MKTTHHNIEREREKEKKRKIESQPPAAESRVIFYRITLYPDMGSVGVRNSIRCPEYSQKTLILERASKNEEIRRSTKSTASPPASEGGKKVDLTSKPAHFEKMSKSPPVSKGEDLPCVTSKPVQPQLFLGTHRPMVECKKCKKFKHLSCREGRTFKPTHKFPITLNPHRPAHTSNHIDQN